METGGKEMKKRTAVFIAACMLMMTASSFAITKTIDNFERNSDLKNPEWWKFDGVTVSVTKNPAAKPGDKNAKEAQKYSLTLRGSARNWYVGGIGTYTGMDAAAFTGIEMAIFGNGEGSGTMRIELYDDDKGSYQTLYDKNWVPLKDDLWTYTMSVNWKGWQKIYIPFSSFAVSNPGRGDGRMNFGQEKDSGGLLQMQIIFTAGEKDGEINMKLDNVKLIAKEDAAD